MPERSSQGFSSFRDHDGPAFLHLSQIMAQLILEISDTSYRFQGNYLPLLWLRYMGQVATVKTFRRLEGNSELNAGITVEIRKSLAGSHRNVKEPDCSTTNLNQLL